MEFTAKNPLILVLDNSLCHQNTVSSHNCITHTIYSKEFSLLYLAPFLWRKLLGGKWCAVFTLLHGAHIVPDFHWSSLSFGTRFFLIGDMA